LVTCEGPGYRRQLQGARMRGIQPQGAQVADCCEKLTEPEPPGIRLSRAGDINGLWHSSWPESKK
jgi:hypothetical protein